MIQVLETNLGMIPTMKVPFRNYNGIISTIPTGGEINRLPQLPLDNRLN